MRTEFAAVVLAGGGARRWAGADKLAFTVDGRSLLQRTVSAVADADPQVVVGPQRPDVTGVRWTREQPTRAGPLAGLVAGLQAAGLENGAARRGFVAVLAADHPYLTGETVTRLVGHVAENSSVSGAVLVDRDGCPQWLVGVWSVDRLRAAIPDDPRDQSVRRALAPLEPEFVPALGEEASDVDTPEDWRRLGGSA